MTIPFNFDAIPTYFRKHGWLKPQENGIHFKRYFFLGWCFSRCQSKERVVFHDHKEIILEPYEFIFGRSTCSEETGISEQSIRTMINQLNTGMNGEILKKSTSKSTSKFTVYKWSTEILSENANQQINQQVTSNQPATNHKAEKQTLRSIDLIESNIATKSYEQSKSIFAPTESLLSAPCLLPLIKDKKKKEESCEIFLGLASINGYEFKSDSVAVWLSKYPIEYLMSHLHDMMARKRIPDDFHAWFSKALSNNYVGEKKRVKENFEFIQDYVKQHRLTGIKIHKKYCTLQLGCGTENYYYDNPNFQAEILRKIENLNEYVG